MEPDDGVIELDGVIANGDSISITYTFDEGAADGDKTYIVMNRHGLSTVTAPVSTAATFDPSILATSGAGHKITGKFTAATWTMKGIKPTWPYGTVVRWKARGRSTDNHRFMVIRSLTTEGWYEMVGVDFGGGEPVALWGDNFEVVE